MERSETPTDGMVTGKTNKTKKTERSTEPFSSEQRTKLEKGIKSRYLDQAPEVSSSSSSSSSLSSNQRSERKHKREDEDESDDSSSSVTSNSQEADFYDDVSP